LTVFFGRPDACDLRNDVAHQEIDVPARGEYRLRVGVHDLANDRLGRWKCLRRVLRMRIPLTRGTAAREWGTRRWSMLKILPFSAPSDLVTCRTRRRSWPE